MRLLILLLLGQVLACSAQQKFPKLIVDPLINVYAKNKVICYVTYTKGIDKKRYTEDSVILNRNGYVVEEHSFSINFENLDSKIIFTYGSNNEMTSVHHKAYDFEYHVKGTYKQIPKQKLIIREHSDINTCEKTTSAHFYFNNKNLELLKMNAIVDPDNLSDTINIEKYEYKNQMISSIISKSQSMPLEIKKYIYDKDDTTLKQIRVHKDSINSKPEIYYISKKTGLVDSITGHYSGNTKYYKYYSNP